MLLAADNCSSVINRNTREAQGGQNISLDLSVEMVRYLIRNEMFLPFSSEKMSEVLAVDGGAGGVLFVHAGVRQHQSSG